MLAEESVSKRNSSRYKYNNIDLKPINDFKHENNDDSD